MLETEDVKRSPKPRILTALLLIIVLSSYVPALCGVKLDYSPIPLDDWRSRAIDWMMLDAPRFGHFSYSSRPYLSSDRNSLIDRVKLAESSAARPFYEKFRNDCAAEKYVYRNMKSGDLQLRNRISPFTIMSFSDSARAVSRFGLKDELAIQYKNYSLFLRARVENEGYRDTDFKGRSWNDDLTGYMDYAMLQYSPRQSLTFGYGRSFRVYGPGDSDRLLLSDSSPAFDQIFMRFNNKWVAFEYFHGRLSNQRIAGDTVVQKYFAAHRFIFKPRKNLEIGISETVLYARNGTGPEWYYMNPFLPFYGEQWNNIQDDNIYFGLDFTWWPFYQTRVYGELLFDDFQYDFVSEPHQMGMDFGISTLGQIHNNLRLDLQYTQIRNYVYSQRLKQNIYTNNNVLIGSSLGSDVDRTRYKASFVAHPDIVIAIGGEYMRKGEGNFREPLQEPVDKSESFLTGEVRKSWSNYVELQVLTGNMLDVVARAGYVDVRGGPEDTKIGTPFAEIRAQYDFQFWVLY